jgi:predicted dehydrogenase
VFGVGHLGRHHARILSTLGGVELIGVVDTNAARGAEIAAAHRTQASYPGGSTPRSWPCRPRRI